MERLSGLDAAFLYLETPSHHMHVAMTMVLDPTTIPGGYSFEKVKAFIRSRLHVAPLFHRRLAEVPFNINHPVWVEDPDFDLDYHVRRIGVPAPGGRRELAELAAQIASNQLDRSRPLWEMWIVEGLKQDRIGVITKVHHCAIDGASGADFLVHLFDLAPTGPDDWADPEPLPVEHLPTDLELLGFAAASLARQTANVIPLIGRTVQSISRVVQGRRDPGKLVGAVPLSAPHTPWTAAVTPHRSVAFGRVPLSEIKRIKNMFGCTVNDAVLALVAGTLREYLDEKGELPEDSLIAICPISVRGEDLNSVPTSANRVSGMFVSLGTDVDDIGDRLAHIKHSTEGAKEEHNAVGASMLMDWAEYASPNVFNMASRLYSNLDLANRHRAIHNVIISNVPGPNFPLYYAGAELVAAYPLGPVMEGCGLNITVFSYRDQVDIGFMACRELIPDVWSLAEALQRAMSDLTEAADQELVHHARAAGKTSATAKSITPPPGAGSNSSSIGTTPAATKAGQTGTKSSAKTAPSPLDAAVPAAKRTDRKTTATAARPAKKSPAKKSPAKKSPAKKSPAKKSTTIAARPAKKSPATRKATAASRPAKRGTAKKSTTTTRPAKNVSA